MPMYQIKKTTTMAETWKIEADSEGQAIEILESGEVDPVKSTILDESAPKIEKLEAAP